MSNHYNVLIAREYFAKDGSAKTAFTKIGVAFPMKGKDGFQVTLEALPLPTIGQSGKIECKLILMLPLDDDKKSSESYAQQPPQASPDSPIPF